MFWLISKAEHEQVVAELAHKLEDTEKDYEKTKNELDTIKQRPKTYTQAEVDELKADHNEELEEIRGELKSTNELLTKTQGIYEETKKDKDTYYAALSKLSVEVGAKDVAILILNDIKTFESFKKDYKEKVEGEAQIKSEKDFQEKMTELTKGNMEWTQNTMGKIFTRALSWPSNNVW